MRAVYAITLDREAAREITHEAFLRLWERREQFTGEARPWLMRVGVNLAISNRRRLLARLRHRPLPMESQDPASIALAELDLDAMRRALLTLSRRDRAVLALRFAQDLSFLEIGRILRRKEATVKTWCHRALQTLQQQLGRVEGNVDVKPIQELR